VRAPACKNPGGHPAGRDPSRENPLCPAKQPPAGPGWIHEIKHDGFRIMARKDERGVRLFSRNGYDFADRFPQIAKAIEALTARSCFIDGEAIVVDSRGLSVFDLRRSYTGITLNEHYEGDGAIIYKHACRFGCEGIVSKRPISVGPAGSNPCLRRRHHASRSVFWNSFRSSS
jgi:ATP-dependent DNA ligase